MITKDNTVLHKTVHVKLRMKKIPSCWVPHSLIEGQEAESVRITRQKNSKIFKREW